MSNSVWPNWWTWAPHSIRYSIGNHFSFLFLTLVTMFRCFSFELSYNDLPKSQRLSPGAFRQDAHPSVFLRLALVIMSPLCSSCSLGNDIQISCFSFEPFGKDLPKSQRLSPDAFIQMAIQLAFFK